MLEGAVILMLVGYVALDVFLSVGIGAIQATVIVLTKRGHLEAIVPQVLALCLSACLVHHGASPSAISVILSQAKRRRRISTLA